MAAWAILRTASGPFPHARTAPLLPAPVSVYPAVRGCRTLGLGKVARDPHIDALSPPRPYRQVRMVDGMVPSAIPTSKLRLFLPRLLRSCFFSVFTNFFFFQTPVREGGQRHATYVRGRAIRGGQNSLKCGSNFQFRPPSVLQLHYYSYTPKGSCRPRCMRWGSEPYAAERHGCALRRVVV